jgi:tRNA A-37 threonylcarbamoyl transferase component Bud32
MRYCQACHRCFNDGVEFCLFDQTPTCEVERLPILIEGKYRLEQLIAHGGMGSVYRATHLQLERAVAIKILRAEFLTDEKVIERFKREARAAARLKHPNVIAVYDFGLLPANGDAYLVMELVEGRSLREEMRTLAARCGQMRRERAVALLRQACAGVEAAHRCGIIHRDLKPDNIMIETEADGAEIVKVLDFGIAKLRENGQALQSLTDEGTFIGTPNYISPEQCTSLPVDARSDVYSLGVILYEMLTGRVPFSGGNTSMVLLRHLQEPPTPPSRFRPDIGQGLEQVVLRALAKNPNKRYGSAAQFADQLAAALRPETPGVEAEAATRERQRLPAVIIPASGPATGPHAASAAVMAMLPLGGAAQSPTREPRLLLESRPRTRYYVGVTVVVLALLGILGYGWQQRASDAAASVTAPFGTQAPADSARLAAREVAGVDSRIPPGPPKTSAARAPSFDPNAARAGGVARGTSVPVSLLKPGASPAATPEFEQAQREVQVVYAVWAATARRGDWKNHLSCYADRVDYYRDGVVPRAQVGARKRRIFSGLDSFWLRFDEAPTVHFKLHQGEPQAEVIFDKQWLLARGRRRAEGKARTLLRLRRDGQGWHIVGERQLRLYYSATRMVKR